jgi:hypothetical protein
MRRDAAPGRMGTVGGFPVAVHAAAAHVAAMRTIILLLLALPLFAAPPVPKPAPENDFDYLLGDWEFTANSKEWGKFHGLWSAVRLDEGQILDEYRIVGGDGKTIYVTTTVRNYNKRLNRWELVGIDAGNGLQDIGTGKRAGAEMHIEQKYGTSLWRIRYYDIGADRFSWTADRSMNDGKTWTTAYQTIEARRIGAARSLPPLTAAKLKIEN